MKMSLFFLFFFGTLHSLFLLYWTLLHYKDICPLMYNATSTQNTVTLPSCTRAKFPPCFSLGATAWCRNCSKSYFSSGNCKWSACLKSNFICHPMKHSPSQSVNYGAINYYLQTSMKYVDSLQNKSTSAWLFFMIRCSADACLNLSCNGKGVQTNWEWCWRKIYQ